MKHFLNTRVIASVAKQSLILTTVALLIAACGDDVTQINQTGLEVADSVKDLPKCTEKNEGDQAIVKGESFIRVCLEGEWFATTSGEGSLAGEVSCSTKELKDGSGLKIICNGDSIGVVLNGEKGDSGKDGKDGKDAELSQDTLEADSERVAISLDSLVGYSQKGPFLKGSTVYLYELSDGRTLKQTNGNFTSNITRDDGRYKFTARDLASQYAMIVVEGNYRNEVTGEPSDASIRLRALTDMRKRSDANINLLTTLEFDRVYHLVTRGDKKGNKLTVKQAKKQAQAEILAAFHIELDGNTDAEDMDVFGATDADAALLAISILLQGDGSATDLSVLLTAIANDMEKDGVWNDSATKVKIADWAAMADGMGRLNDFRKNVANWGLSDTVPVFERFVRKFYTMETGLGKCGSEDIPVGTVKRITNSMSGYRDELYSDSASMVRFVCDDAEKARWRLQSDIEKDTLGWGDTTEGTVRNGRINPNLTYVYQGDSWRHGTAMDSLLVQVGGTACLNDGDTSKVKYDSLYYMCTRQTAGDTARKWVVASDIFNDTWEMHDGCKELGEYGLGNIVAGRVNTERNYVCENGAFRPVTSAELARGRVCVDYIQGQIFKVNGKFQKCDNKKWKAVADIGATGVMKDAAGREYKTVLVGDQLWMKENLDYEMADSYCYDNSSDMCAKYGRLYRWTAAKKACPTGWHLPSLSELSTMVTYAESIFLSDSADAGQILKAKYRWKDNSDGSSGDGTDYLGFSVLPAGYYEDYVAVGFFSEGFTAYILSSTENCTLGLHCLAFYSSRNNVRLGGCMKEGAYSVRCILDE